jgi:hypothetical protein
MPPDEQQPTRAADGHELIVVPPAAEHMVMVEPVIQRFEAPS